MCAILDANACADGFGKKNRPESGKKFFKWINSGKGRLIVGGKLRRELLQNEQFKEWAEDAIDSGRLRECEDKLVDARESNLRDIDSNDAHIIALAIESRSRLLCTNDEDLKADFKNKKLIDNPRGSVYSTRPRTRFDKGKRNLLENCNCH